MPGAGGSHLYFYLLGRQRSGGSQFEACLGKHLERFYLKKLITKKGWWSDQKKKLKLAHRETHGEILRIHKERESCPARVPSCARFLLCYSSHHLTAVV
jgi:hypothetical protein